ncbi:MAG: NAD-dependent succinate-semialdehyde dehydrogenase [Myxococcales bacterium]|nr:NAD-dependent succinate-semialdehyde dehydrogenase [Myxococcales bacterium]
MNQLRTDNLIGGEWTRAASSFEVRNPATDEVIAEVPNGGQAEARQALAAARSAFPGWRAASAETRAILLGRLADLMMTESERLARLLTTEQGKPLAEARGEIAYAASFIRSAAGEATRVHGEVLPSGKPEKRILVLRQPVGVTAAITPWNFPAAMITRKLGPALAAGCTMVVKPAEQTPLSALALAELCERVGFPAGVVNVITGDPRAIGAELMDNPTLAKLSFTGSTEVGQLLMRGAAKNLLRLSLELGGHAPFIVFDDADVDQAVLGALSCKYRNAGQTCISANRFYVQSGVYERFRDALAARLGAMKVGPGVDAGVEVGPLIDDAAVEKVQHHVADALERGASLRLGGSLADLGAKYTKRFYVPTLLEGFTHEMLCAREETFGPVSPLRRFEHEDEVVQLANDSEFGLASYFYTRDLGRAFRVAERLEYGIVGVNDGAPSTAQAPFGGVKHSGFGREGGHFVMHEYLNVKYVSLGVG